MSRNRNMLYKDQRIECLRLLEQVSEKFKTQSEAAEFLSKRLGVKVTADNFKGLFKGNATSWSSLKISDVCLETNLNGPSKPTNNYLSNESRISINGFQREEAIQALEAVIRYAQFELSKLRRS